MIIQSYSASCDCNNITYNFYSAELYENWNVRKCSCSFCIRYVNHIYCSDPNGYIKFNIKFVNLLNVYNHGTNTADFLVCKCHSYMGAVMKTKQGVYAVINLEFLKDKIRTFKPYKLKWKNEDKETRMSRRYKTWTPVKNYNI